MGAAYLGVTVFSVATIAMFTFYFTADSPRLTRMFLSWFPPQTQERVGWTLDQAVVQTGGYIYSRTVLRIINGLGFFFVLVLVGMPVSFAVPLSRLRWLRVGVHPLDRHLHRCSQPHPCHSRRGRIDRSPD